LYSQKISFYVRLPSQISQRELEIPKKQAIYMRTQLSLLLRLSSNTIESEQKLKYYAELLDKANFLVVSAGYTIIFQRKV